MAGGIQGTAALEAFSGALFMARAAEGRQSELLPLLETGENPAGGRPIGLDVWMLGKAYVLASVGRETEAQPIVGHMTDVARQVPLDRIRSIELTQLILVGQLVDNREAIEAGYELLVPYHHHHCVAPGMTSIGSAEVFPRFGGIRARSSRRRARTDRRRSGRQRAESRQ